MKVLSLSIAVVLLAGTFACSTSGDSQATKTSSPTPSPTVEHLRRWPADDQYASLVRYIPELTKNLRIKSLKDDTNHRGIELRIYIGGGLFFPRCFIYRSVGDQHNAFLIDAKVRNNKTVIDSAGNVQPETKILAPISGWDSFEKGLAENGVGSTLDLKFDEYDVVDPDEGSLTLEFRTENNYSLISYSRDNESPDAQKAKRICELVKKEFRVQLDCSS